MRCADVIPVGNTSGVALSKVAEADERIGLLSYPLARLSLPAQPEHDYGQDKNYQVLVAHADHLLCI